MDSEDSVLIRPLESSPADQEWIKSRREMARLAGEAFGIPSRLVRPLWSDVDREIEERVRREAENKPYTVLRE